MAERRHSCPGGCGQSIPVHLLACPADWRRLPEDLRKAVNIAYARRQLDPAGHRDAVAQAAQWYQDNAPEPAGMVAHRRGKPNRKAVT